MTKTDAEQHSMVWDLARKMINIQMEKAMQDKIEILTAAHLANSDLAAAVSKSYETMAKAIEAGNAKS